MMNKPKYNDPIQWGWDYNVSSFNAGTYLETITYKYGGSFNTTSGAYTGGVTVGYVYVLYDDSSKSNFVASYHKKA